LELCFTTQAVWNDPLRWKRDRDLSELFAVHGADLDADDFVLLVGREKEEKYWDDTEIAGVEAVRNPT